MQQSSGTLAVRNLPQQVLWNEELRGQISDGMWENAQPWDHWEQWCKATVIVDPFDVGRDFWVKKDAYMFNDKELLEIVGERMLHYVRVALLLGYAPENDVHFQLSTLVDYALAGDDGGAYNVGLRAALAVPGIVDAIKAAAADETLYTVEQRDADLRDLRRIIKVRR